MFIGTLKGNTKTNVMNPLKKLIINGIRGLGYDLVKSHPAKELNAVLKRYEIQNVIDVGANEGQYAMGIRKNGYKGQIHSFEPMTKVFRALNGNLLNDPLWKSYNYGLGEKEEDVEINVSSNSPSSSILTMTEVHNQAAPDAVFKYKEIVHIKTLDAFADKIGIGKQATFLKIDTQGFELNILKGAPHCLKYINTIQLEMSTTHLYQGEPLFFEISQFLYERNFRLIKVFPGFSDKQSGEMLQFDGIFRRDL